MFLLRILRQTWYITLLVAVISLFVIVYLNFYPNGKSGEFSGQIPDQLSVCAFANAQNIRQLTFTAAQWPGIPIWFVLWGQDVDDPEIVMQIGNLDSRIHVLNGKNTDHASGWALAVEAAKKSGERCDYFFSMDDDLTWSISTVGLERYDKDATFTEILLGFLEEYVPAVAVFPWPWGDGHFKGLKSVNELYKGRLVQPATGFDNGCIVFHKGVIDFFVPFHLGKGFTPKFVVQHAFLNYFIPFMFRGNAIRFNGLQYYNPSLQRHSYDNDALVRYSQYLRNNSKCSHKRSGPDLLPSDIAWEVERGDGTYCWDMMDRIAAFYPLLDTVIADHPQVKALYQAVELQFKEEQTAKLIDNRNYSCTEVRGLVKQCSLPFALL